MTVTPHGALPLSGFSTMSTALNAAGWMAFDSPTPLASSPGSGGGVRRARVPSVEPESARHLGLLPGESAPYPVATLLAAGLKAPHQP